LRWHADGGEVRRGLAVGLWKEETQKLAVIHAERPKFALRAAEICPLGTPYSPSEANLRYITTASP
jgi:hypothetical protein